jgi:hypothetical protein
MQASYSPELDGTLELDADGTHFYQELIGMLRWATELGRTDILHEVSILSQYQACPREGHVEQLLGIFGFLKVKYKKTIHLNPDAPNSTNFKVFIKTTRLSSSFINLN